MYSVLWSPDKLRDLSIWCRSLDLITKLAFGHFGKISSAGICQSGNLAFGIPASILYLGPVRYGMILTSPVIAILLWFSTLV